MTPQLQSGFDVIERHRVDLQSRVLALDDAQLSRTPDGATWSVLQIVEHLVLSDETVGCAQDAGAVRPEAPMFRILPRAWRRTMILGALNRDTVLPLPSPDVEPQGTVPLSALLSRWDTARREMRHVLDTLRGSETRYAHPVLGPLTAAQMLDLAQAHTAYHTRQMQMLQRDSAFPCDAEAGEIARQPAGPQV